ncbi:MAG: hypothetical protein JWO03_639 [Bacteroidetes bacterium]|nr:hypothetical protein [Bacteroidota bacterium]
MMKRIYFLLLVISATLPCFAFQHIASYTLYKTVTAAEFREMAQKRHLPKSVVPAKYTVDVYDVTYYTQWHDGSKIRATGLYFVPRDAKKPVAEMVYEHGTRVSRGRDADLGGQENICLGFAMDGYAVMQPDYIGLGNGDKFHLYQVSESEGQASVDMIYATRELNDSLHVKTSGQLFLTGYSQGGHAALATQQLIEKKYGDKLHVTASSPMSGAYDMCGVQGEVMFHSYSRPHYLPYLLASFNEVYHFVPGDINKIYKHPYDSLVPLLFDGKHSIRAIDKALPAVPKDMILDEFVESYIHDTTNPLRIALRENSLCEWKPQAPVQLCYCDSDEQVTPRNALVAYKTMKAMGAEHVTLRRAGKNFSHTRCALIATLYTKMYFDTFRRGSKYGGKGTWGPRIVANMAKSMVKKSGKKHKGGEKPKSA